MISFEEFKQLDLRIAEIVDVDDHPNADNLLLLKVDVGEEEPVQSVAGLKGYYEPDQLTGKKIAVLRNLETATIRGEKSEAMLLAATGNDDVVVLTPDPEKETSAGMKIQ